MPSPAVPPHCRADDRVHPTGWRRRVAVAALAAALGGCSADGLDSSKLTEFRPLGPGTYRYEALADISFPEDDAEAEATRVGWLERYLDDAGACPGGYDVTERRPVVIRQAALGPVHRIEYTVVCRREEAR